MAELKVVSFEGGRPETRREQRLVWTDPRDAENLAGLVADHWWCRLSGWTPEEGRRVAERIRSRSTEEVLRTQLNLNYGDVLRS
jgi:hypothetical protein